MTQARSTLPAHLQRARLATIAKDPAFRRYFASADDSATIRKVLVRLFDSQGKRREQLAIEREARSRRSQQASKRRTRKKLLAVRLGFLDDRFIRRYTVFQVDSAWSQRPSRACWAILPDDPP